MMTFNIRQLADRLMRSDPTLKNEKSAINRVHYLVRAFPNCLSFESVPVNKNTFRTFTKSDADTLIDLNYRLRTIGSKGRKVLRGRPVKR